MAKPIVVLVLLVALVWNVAYSMQSKNEVINLKESAASAEEYKKKIERDLHLLVGVIFASYSAEDSKLGINIFSAILLSVNETACDIKSNLCVDTSQYEEQFILHEIVHQYPSNNPGGLWGFGRTEFSCFDLYQSGLIDVIYMDECWKE